MTTDSTPAPLLEPTPPLTPEREAEIRAILAERQACRSDPVAFARAIGFEPALHHRLILQAIKELLVDDQADVLILLMPPGSAKSTYGNVTAASWVLLRDPTIDVLMACNVGELAQRFGRQIRGIVAGEVWQKLSGSPVSLADDSSAAGRWNTSAGGGLYAVGVGAAVLGRRADVLILDDLVASFEVASNPQQLFKIQEWIKSDALSRLKPHGKVICIMQRMAFADPAGFLMRHFQGTSTRVHVINLPMEADELDDPLGRTIGERLWPEWFSDRFVETAKLDAARWQTMYMQRPLADIGEFFDPRWIDTRLPPPHPDHMAVSLCVDLATGAPGGDYTVIAVTAKFLLQGQPHLYLLHVLRQRISVLQAVDALVSLKLRYNATEFLIDDDSLWKASKELIYDRMSSVGHYIHPQVIKMGGQDKPTRAGPLRAMLMAGRVHFMPGAPWLPALEHEFESFPLAVGNGVDDQVDAIGLLPRKLVRAVGALGGPSAQQTFEVGIAGSSETVTVPAHFGSAYKDRMHAERDPGRPPGMVTASMTDRRLGESQEDYIERKHTDRTRRFMEEHGVVVSRTGRVSITAASFDPPTRRDERL